MDNINSHSNVNAHQKDINAIGTDVATSFTLRPKKIFENLKVNKRQTIKPNS